MPPEVPVPRTVLVTGVSRHLGAVVAARLAADPAVSRVIAVDTAPPEGGPAALLAAGPHSGPRPSAAPNNIEFVSADIRNPLIAKVVAASGVDTVVHTAVFVSSARIGARPAMKELNVIGTMQLLAACQKAPTVRKLVVKSSVAAYGASPRDPAMFTEETEPRQMPRGGYAKDIVEIEGYVRGFSRRRPEVSVTVLRFAPFLGAGLDNPLTRYLSLPLVPTALGYDPRMQFVHATDALEVLHRSVVEEHPGVYNVAGEGVLLLSQAIRRAGRVPVPVPSIAMSSVAGLARRSGLLDFSLDQLDFLMHGRVVDTARLVEEFGFRPRRTAEAFDDFVSSLASVINPATVAAVERMLADRVGHARHASSQPAGQPAGRFGKDD